VEEWSGVVGVGPYRKYSSVEWQLRSSLNNESIVSNRSMRLSGREPEDGREVVDEE